VDILYTRTTLTRLDFVFKIRTSFCWRFLVISFHILLCHAAVANYGKTGMLLYKICNCKVYNK